MKAQHATSMTLRPDQSRKDVLLWKDDPMGNFLIPNTWESLRSQGPKTPRNNVLHSKAIPQHVVFLWLTIRDGLYTQNKLQAFGIIQEVKCIFCG